MNLFKDITKKIKLEKREEKMISKSKEKNEEKNNLCDDNNDSFITELHNLFPNEKRINNDSQQNLNEQTDEIDKNNESDDDKEPDPRINFEQINR